MNSVKILFFIVIFSISTGLHFSAISMESEIKEREELIKKIVAQKKALWEKKERAQQRYEQESFYKQELERLLSEVSKDWKRGPSDNWQNSIVIVALALIELNNQGLNYIKTIFGKINKTIDDYSKTLWFPDKKAITVAKYDVFKAIDISTTQKFEKFKDYFYRVARSPVDIINTFDVAGNNPAIHWIFNKRKTYFDLKPTSLEDIANKAVELIKDQGIPLGVIEYAMDKELQEAYKAGKSKLPEERPAARLRSAAGLGIMKAIKAKL